MATDDVHDLFDKDEAEESADSGAESDEEDPSVDFPPLKDDESADDADPAGEEPSESTTASDGAVEDDSTGSEPVTTDDVHEFFDDDGVEEPDGSGESIGERSAGEPGESTARTDEAPTEEEGSVGPADRERGETTGPTTTTSDGAPEDDRGTFESDESSTTSGEDIFGGTGSSESMTSGAGESEGHDGRLDPSTDALGRSSDDDASESESSDSSTLDPGSTEEHDAPGPRAESSVGEETGAAESDATDAGAFDPAELNSSAGEDGGDSSEPSGAAIFSDDVETEERGETTSGNASAAREGATPVDRQPSGSGGVAGSTDETSASDRSGAASGGSMETAEEPSPDDSRTAESAGESAASSGTSADDRAPSTSTASDGPTAGDGFVTASPTEPEAPVVDEETAASTLSESGRLSTGVDVLDDAMGGGVPPGRLVVLVADPGVQSELIVDSVLTQRDTLYVTTDRPDWEVQKDIEPGLGSGEIKVEEHTPDSLLSGVDTLLDEIGTTSNFVLDSVNELELVERGRYRIFLSDVKRRLFETGSVGLLTGVTVDHDSARDLTLRRADIVWRIETRTTGGELEHWLSVPKFRGGAAMSETVKLELTDQVRVDPEWRDD